MKLLIKKHKPLSASWTDIKVVCRFVGKKTIEQIGRDTMIYTYNQDILPEWTGLAKATLAPYYKFFHLPVLGNASDVDPADYYSIRPPLVKLQTLKPTFQLVTNLDYFKWNDTLALGHSPDPAHDIVVGLEKATPWNVGSRISKLLLSDIKTKRDYVQLHSLLATSIGGQFHG